MYGKDRDKKQNDKKDKKGHRRTREGQSEKSTVRGMKRDTKT